MSIDIKVCKAGDADYPSAFNGLSGMPERFYYCGNISVFNETECIAVIGSRNCDETVLRLAYEAGRIAAEEELCLVNGLALGCDTEALKGALDNNGRCAVVLPGGLGRIYPQSNERLAVSILEKGGCIVSEYEPNASPQKYTFIERDRLQSALSSSVLVIAAENSSGTMHTVRAAKRQHRRLGAYSAKLVHMSGNEDMTRSGATEISNPDDLRGFLRNKPDSQAYQQLSLFDVV